MRVIRKLLFILFVFGSAFVALELSKYLSKTRSENLIIALDENFEQLPEANNLPDVIFNKEYLRWKPNNKCAKFPQLHEIRTSNIYWQLLAQEDGNKLENLYLSQDQRIYYLFGAYFDTRGPDVKVLGMVRGNPADLNLYCNIWFEKGVEPRTIKASYHYIWNTEWKMKPHLLNPYLFSCKLPDTFLLNKQLGSVPKAVSLIGEPCQKATNLLKVNYNKESNHADESKREELEESPKKNFMVCVKGLDFPEDISYKLIEWIELIRLLGADKIHFYVLNVHVNVAKVLEHYKQVGWIIKEGLSIPGNKEQLLGQKNYYKNRKFKNRPQQKRHELIPYNDCFYKHREEYKYVVLLDVDEIIMPNIGNWKNLIDKMQLMQNANMTSTFSVSNAYFFDELLQADKAINSNLYNDNSNEKYQYDIPGHMHMLKHVHRTRNITQPSLFVKGFHNSSDIVSLHNHFPIECKNASCKETKIHQNTAKLAHYRSCPVILGNKCKELRKDYVRDDSILRFREDLLENVQKSVKQIGFEL